MDETTTKAAKAKGSTKQKALLTKKQEAFARGQARGLTQTEANAAAGYSRRNASRVAKNPAVQARIAELTKRIAWSETRDVLPLIESLKEAFDKALALDTGASLTAARGLVAEAARLKQMLPREKDAADERARRLQPLSDEEWTKLYGPSAP